jgi:hypothetical protein
MTAQKLGVLAVALLLAANVIIPVIWGDVYPFTSAPMFREAPVQCCHYRVVVDGKEQPADKWLLQRVYDGNPVGYGVGVCPPAVLEQEYGVIHDEAAVRSHIERQLALPENHSISQVEVIQEVVGAVGSAVGVVQTRRWQIQRP